MDNLAEQCEEIEALKSIYDNNFQVETAANCYSIQINQNVKLFLTLTEDYPACGPPKYELLAPTLSPAQKQQISDEFHQIYENSMGAPILFEWIEKLKELTQTPEHAPEPDSPPLEKCEEIKNETHNFEIIHGEIIQDRKSVFQGHASRVHSLEDIKTVMNILLSNKKVAQATHNILAYRVLTPKGTILQDCDDDGESHAGGRILHLLQILDLSNVMVVVTRWYGGVHLGPDRFKHINNAARQVLAQGGFLSS